VTTNHQFIHKKFPTVIMLKGRWCELSCKYCGANASRNARRSTDSLGDLHGFHRHINQTHQDICGHVGYADVTDHCDARVVGNKDVTLLRQGRNAQEKPVRARFDEAAVDRRRDRDNASRRRRRERDRVQGVGMSRGSQSHVDITSDVSDGESFDENDTETVDQASPQRTLRKRPQKSKGFTALDGRDKDWVYQYESDDPENLDFLEGKAVRSDSEDLYYAVDNELLDRPDVKMENVSEPEDAKVAFRVTVRRESPNMVV